MSDDFRHQIVEFLPRLRRFAYALTKDPELGDDLVQEACVRALTHREQWQPGTRLDSWMYRIAQNLWFDRLRARKVRGDVVDIEEATTLVGEDGRTVTENRLTLKAVAAAMETLAPEQQVVIALVCVEGLSYKEAAEVLDVPIGTVMSRLARGRRALFELVKDDAGGPVFQQSVNGND